MAASKTSDKPVEVKDSGHSVEKKPEMSVKGGEKAAENKPVETGNGAKPGLAEVKPEESKPKEEPKSAEKADPPAEPKPAEQAKPVAQTTTAPAPPPTEPSVNMASVLPTPGAGEKPKRKFHFSLPSFGRKKQTQAESLPKSVAVDSPVVEVTPEDVVNSLDGAVKIVKKTKAQELAETLEAQIKDTGEDDYLTVKLHKKQTLMVLGVLVGMMWVVPVLRGVEHVFLGGKSVFEMLSRQKSAENETEETDAMGQEASESAQIKIRVKNSSGSDDEVNTLVGMLKESSYDFVEIVADETDQEGVVLVTKASSADLQTALMRLLQDKYSVATSSAELSADSDFDAVILFGKQEGGH